MTDPVFYALRNQLADEMAQSKRRLRLIGPRNREIIATEFLLTVEGNNLTEQEARREFERRIRYALPLPVIILIINIVWDVIWWLWTRNKNARTTSQPVGKATPPGG